MRATATPAHRLLCPTLVILAQRTTWTHCPLPVSFGTPTWVRWSTSFGVRRTWLERTPQLIWRISRIWTTKSRHRRVRHFPMNNFDHIYYANFGHRKPTFYLWFCRVEWWFLAFVRWNQLWDTRLTSGHLVLGALGGIPILIDLLNSNIPEIQRNACSALRNLCFGRGNDENKVSFRRLRA